MIGLMIGSIYASIMGATTLKVPQAKLESELGKGLTFTLMFKETI